MRKIILAAGSALSLWSFTHSALAEDRWTQFYAGVYGDYSILNTHLSGGNSYVFDVKGFSGGVMLGYDHQFDMLVAGVEADVGYDGVSGGYYGIGGPWNVDTRGVNFAGRVRLGIAQGDFLLYGTGGVASTPFNVNYNNGFSVINQNEVGWQAGLGAEYAVNEHVNVRGEYLYTGYGDLGTALGTTKMPTNTSTFRIGVAYKF